MKRFAVLVAASFLLASCQDASDPMSPPSAELSVDAAVDGEMIVLLDPALAPDGHEQNQGLARKVARDLGVQPRHAYGTAVFGFSGVVPEGRLRALERDPRVVHAEPVEIWELALVSMQSTQTLPTGIDRSEVDRNPSVTTDGSGGVAVDLDVAIIDTGIDPDHPDLNVAGGRNFQGGNPNNWSDGHGHGTHVSGTVAAIDNEIGVVGVAPGARVWAVRVCSNGGRCATSDMVAGIDWVADQKASGTVDFAVANFSISSADSDNECSDPANAVHAAICGLVDEGVVFSLAAGNNNRDKTPFPVTFSVSAIADFDGVAGGAGAPTCRTDTDDTLASFSNFGERVDIAGPGVCILSTVPGGYGTASGTSMAAPHVAGAVALYLHANGESPATDRAGADAIKDAIVAAAHPQGTENHECSYDDSRVGGPLLFTNAAAFGGDGSCGVANGEPAPEPETGTVAGTVTDAETGDPIEAASVNVDGTGLSATTEFDGSYAIEDVPEGTHDVTASADGYESATQQATVSANQTTTVNFALQLEDGEEPGPDPEGTVTVASITYSGHGGPNGDRHLRVTIAVEDDAGNPVADASVSATLDNLDTGGTWTFSGTTNGGGTVTLQLNNAPSGCYETTVTDVSADGLAWDGETPENGHCKP